MWLMISVFFFGCVYFHPCLCVGLLYSKPKVFGARLRHLCGSHKLIFVNVIARQIHNDSLAYLLCALTPRQGRALAVEQQINEFGRLNIHHVFVHDACQLSATLVSLNLISNSTRGLMFAPLLVCVWCPIAVCSQRVLCHFELEAFLSC